MCTPNHNTLLTYGLKVPAPAPFFPLNPSAAQLSALDLHRSQLCEYNARVQLSLRGYTHALASLSPYHGAYLADPYTQYLYKGDPRARFVQEEPKPSHSYIGLIAMAILSSKEKKLVLSDIYQWILDNYPYFRTRGPGWRNSIRHNLSLNDCFIKAGRSANGKGHYWAVHPANVDDFTRGDFRRRRAQRKVRKHMGLSVPDDDDDSPSPSPNPISWMHNGPDAANAHNDQDNGTAGQGEREEGDGEGGESEDVDVDLGSPDCQHRRHVPRFLPLSGGAHVSKKRLFDVESLLAPDLPVVVVPKVRLLPSAGPSYNYRPGDDKTATDGHLADNDDDSDVDIETEDVGGCDVTHTMALALRRSDTEVLCGDGDEDVTMVTVEDGAGTFEQDDEYRGGAHTANVRLLPLPTSTATSVLDLSASSVASQLFPGGTPGRGNAGLTQTLIQNNNPNGQRLVGRRPVLGVDLGLGRYSAFHASCTGGARSSLSPSAVPFLHPVLAVSRYPALLPPVTTTHTPMLLTDRVDSVPKTSSEEVSLATDKI